MRGTFEVGPWVLFCMVTASAQMPPVKGYLNGATRSLRHYLISVPKLEQSADGCANFWWGAGTLFQFETDGPSMATAYMKFWDV